MSDFEKTGSRLVLTLFLARSLYTAAYILMFTVAAIAAVELAGDDSRWTGVPGTLVLAGAALIAYPIGRLMDRAGRRAGLSLGFLFGAAGALVSGWAVIQRSLPLFLGGAFLVGTARGAIEMGRYAAAEASPPQRRGRAISLFTLGGTVGSVVGPALVDAANRAGLGFGLPDLTGPWFAGALVLLLGTLLVFAALRPDPQVIARHFDSLQPDPPAPGEDGRTARQVLGDDRAKLAVAAMVFGQLAMVVVMTVTAVYMRGERHELSAISLVIMAHTLGMFGLSYLTGWLVDRFGRVVMIVAGSLVLVASCLMAPFSTGVWWLAAALFLLGLGWNFCFVAGSALLDDLLKSHEKGRVQGAADTLVSVASGVGSLSSGLAFAAGGFALTSWGTILLGAVPLALLLVLKANGRAPALEKSAAG